MKQHQNCLLNVLSLGALSLLVVEFILGMMVNLYVEFPDANQENAWHLMNSSVPVFVHVLFGSLLVLVAIAHLISAIASRKIPLIVFSFLGSLGVIFAAISGSSFMENPTNLNSFLMSLGFVLALLSYMFVLYLCKRDKSFI